MASIRPEPAAFFTKLHLTWFKPQGFKKKHHTFSKDYGQYIVRYQFQGSTWNDRNDPWRFYLNVGIQFTAVPKRTPDRDFPETHTWGRVAAPQSSHAEVHYDLTMETIDSTVAKISLVAADYVRYFEENHQRLLNTYRQKPGIYLATLEKDAK